MKVEHHKWDQCPSTREPGELPQAVCRESTQQQDCALSTRKQAIPRHQICPYLESGLRIKTVRIKFLVLKSHPVFDNWLWQPKQTKTANIKFRNCISSSIWAGLQLL